MRLRRPGTGRIADLALRALIVSACAVVAGLLGCGGLPPVNDGEGGGTVVVLAVEAATGAPLQVPATIIVGGVRGTLRPNDQQLILRDVPIGTGTPPTQPLTASAEGFVTKTQQVQMQVTAATWVTVELEPADPATTGTVAGTVTDADTGEPVVSAFVQFAPPGGDEEGTVGGYTASDGAFLVRGIPAGQRAVTVQAEGFLAFATTVTIRADSAGPNEDLRFQLVAGDTTVTVTGRVVDVLTRLPIVNAQVTIGGVGPLTTGPDGRFTAPDVLVGNQTATVTADGYEDLSTQVRVLPGMGEITLELFEAASDPPGSPYTIGGTVTLNGAPDNAGATVTARSLESGAVLDEDETPASGRYRLFVPPGRYEVSVTFGERSISREVTVPTGGVIVDGINFVLTVQ